MNNELKHFGIPGMRWGVRKKREKASSTGDRIVVRKAGETLHHISSNPNLSPDVRELYTSFTKKDVLRYRGEYADQLRAIKGIDEVYNYKLKAAKDLVAPSKKKAIDELISLVKDDPAVISQIVDVKLNTGLIMQTAKALGFKNQSAEAKAFRKRLLSNDKNHQEAAFKDYVKYMILTDKAKEKYFSRLEKQGFNSMYDANDMLSGYSEKPLIVFNSKKNLTITSKEIDDQAATDRVFSELEKLIKETG